MFSRIGVVNPCYIIVRMPIIMKDFAFQVAYLFKNS
jgi:hypothetical protein